MSNGTWNWHQKLDDKETSRVEEYSSKLKGRTCKEMESMIKELSDSIKVHRIEIALKFAVPASKFSVSVTDYDHISTMYAKLLETKRNYNLHCT